MGVKRLREGNAALVTLIPNQRAIMRDSTKETAKQVLKAAHLDGLARRSIKNLTQIERRLRGVDRVLTTRYFLESEARKLHIGCGHNLLHGWLSADLFPCSDEVFRLDATKPFPFPDQTFDYVFSEHMIEHVSYSSGLIMLRECFRVLKSGGRIRISTPDLKFLIDLYCEVKSELQIGYIKWAINKYIPWATDCNEVFVINNFVRDWGHLFIYDEKTLRSSLTKAGFSAVTRHELNASEDEALRNLENEGRMPKGFLKLESIILEARK
jgi:predicted SAM-dependent methyltransferase